MNLSYAKDTLSQFAKRLANYTHLVYLLFQFLICHLHFIYNTEIIYIFSRKAYSNLSHSPPGPFFT